jgi:hypothetical protein
MNTQAEIDRRVRKFLKIVAVWSVYGGLAGLPAAFAAAAIDGKRLGNETAMAVGIAGAVVFGFSWMLFLTCSEWAGEWIDK